MPRRDRRTSTAKCASCHSATGDLQGHRDPDLRSRRRCRTHGWRAAAADGVDAAARRRQPSPSRRTVTATVTLPSGETVEGRLVRIDDFLVTRAAGRRHASARFRRNGDVPKVEVHDPMKAHRDLLARLHRQRHARRDRLPGDLEMKFKTYFCRTVPACCRPSCWDRAAASTPADLLKPLKDHGRLTTATTPASATAR